MGKWKPISEATDPMDECLLWCTDSGAGKPIVGAVFGRIYVYDDAVVPRGNGMGGDWTFTHFMPVPEGPKA